MAAPQQPSRSDRAVEIAAQAMQQPAERRRAFIEAACAGDPTLMAEAASLAEGQSSRDSAAPTLADPSEAETIMRPEAEGTGTQIGPYKLLQLIGEGGFGSVFMAEQSQPVRRRVALKIIKLGMDTRQVVARFEAERQALAMMDHPNIARVLDAGATEAGRPYFVMELVKGEPITCYCDRQNLSIVERLALFAQVCNAVQHAHQKGIIHRDIKPTNVLVSTEDGKAFPKVIDFGIAKATAARLTEKTLFTEHRTFIGTPEYMSPEQAEGSMDIDTRTDVYSLGVVLYELLAGATPFDGGRLRSAAYGEMQRIIREVDPPKPSTRLSQDTATAASVAARRHTEPRKLGALIRGELDWIVMKALEKDRQRRYETASGLAMDVARYLAGEAVLAAPASAAYRVRKFVRRNRGLVTATGLVAAALIVGIIGTTWGLVRAERSRQLAVAEALRASAAEAETLKRAQELRQVADFQGQMLSQVDPAAAGVQLTENVRVKFDAALVKSGVPGDERAGQLEAFAGQWSRVNATDTALELIDLTILRPAAGAIDTQFADQPAVAATLRHVLAERYHDLGMDAEALALEEQALAIRRRELGEEHPDTLLSIGNKGAYLSALGRKDEAESHHRDALEKSRRVRGEDHPETLVCIANVGNLLLDQGKPAEAEPYFREALERRRRALGEEHEDTLRSIADWAMLLRAQGKLNEAEAVCRDALSRRRRVLGEDHRDTLSSANSLGALLKDQGKLDDAIVYFREVSEKRRRLLGEAHPATLSAIQNLGAVLDAAGHPQEAEALMRETLDRQRRLLGADHASTLATMGNLSVFLIGQDKFTEAEPMARETLERRTRVLGADHTATLIANNVMGLALIRQGKRDEGERYWREAMAIAQKTLGPAHPETLTYVHNLAGFAIDQDKDAEAEKLFGEVIAEGGPAIGEGHPIVLSATRRLAGMMLGQKRYAEADALLSAAEPAARETYTGSSERNLALLLRDLGAARTRLEQFAAAEPNVLEAHDIFMRTRGPAHAETRGCTEMLVDFYGLWDKAEPGKGHDAKVAEWKANLEALPAPPATAPSVTP